VKFLDDINAGGLFEEEDEGMVREPEPEVVPQSEPVTPAVK
jgi:hypothetical protein